MLCLSCMLIATRNGGIELDKPGTKLKDLAAEYNTMTI